MNLQNLLPAVPVPTLVMNSMVDSWQLLFAFNWRKLRIDDAYEGDEILQVRSCVSRKNNRWRGICCFKQEYARPVREMLRPSLWEVSDANPNISTASRFACDDSLCVSACTLRADFMTYSCIVHCFCKEDRHWNVPMTGGYTPAHIVQAWYGSTIVKLFDEEWTWPQLPHCPPMGM